MMDRALASMLARIEYGEQEISTIIRWGAPILAFGDVSCATVATLGLNPSNREFVDEAGRELDGGSRRFHTLKSLGLESWLEADSRHLSLILDSCRRYFSVNPYDQWFKKLERVLSKTGTSFYSETRTACHLDLVPYATGAKWTELGAGEKSALLTESGDLLGRLIRDSQVQTLVMNGRSVVGHFRVLTCEPFSERVMATWTLPRRSTAGVSGIAYRGTVTSIAGIELDRELLVLGYNHNLQSSFGVTNIVIDQIRNWIASQISRWEG